MKNPARKVIAATATTALMFGGSVALGVSGFAAPPSTTTTSTSTTSTSTTSSTTTSSTTTSTTMAPTTTMPATTTTTILVPGSLEPTTVPAGGTTHLTLPGMPPNTEAVITLAKGDVHDHSPDDVLLTKAASDADGLLDVLLTIPADTEPGTYTVLIQFEHDDYVYFKSITVTEKAVTPPGQTPPAQPVSAKPSYTG